MWINKKYKTMRTKSCKIKKLKTKQQKDISEDG